MTDWAKLAEPFPDSEVKQRPGAAKYDHKEACQGTRCRDTKDPNAHHQFSYVDARAVMQRLDDVLTPEGWDFQSSVLPGTDIVRGELRVGGSIRVDYGYPNSDRDEEPVKAASSDALKRAAVMFGVGRHLYSDNTPSSGRGGSSTPRPPARPTVVRDEPAVEEPADLFADREEFPAFPVAKPGDICDVHNEPWRGETGDLYHKSPNGYHRHPGNTKKRAAR